MGLSAKNGFFEKEIFRMFFFQVFTEIPYQRIKRSGCVSEFFGYFIGQMNKNI
jgi:hypothetical protein